MKKILIIFGGILFLAGCKKPLTPAPQNMVYTDLYDKKIRFRESFFLDLDKDGIPDIFFHTLLVGDPVAQQDKEKYFVSSRINAYLPVNAQENAPILEKGEPIPINNFNDYTWYEVSLIELAQKVTGVSGPPFWEGTWKSSRHKYLPVQVRVSNSKYNGWIELSFDTDAEKIILHKAAISSEAGIEVIAGV